MLVLAAFLRRLVEARGRAVPAAHTTIRLRPAACQGLIGIWLLAHLIGGGSDSAEGEQSDSKHHAKQANTSLLARISEPLSAEELEPQRY